jgi:Spinocerebellar ataxia type 10 protein domain
MHPFIRNSLENLKNITFTITHHPSLIARLSDESARIRHSAAEALGSLAFNHPTNKDLIRENKGLSRLVQCCSDQNTSVREYAIFAILLLSESHKINIQELLKLKVIDALIRRRANFRLFIFNWLPNTKTYTELALAVFVLSGLHDQYPILNTITLNSDRIVGAIKNRDYQIRYVAISLILRLCESKRYQAELNKLDLCRRIIKLLEDQHPLVNERARIKQQSFCKFQSSS